MARNNKLKRNRGGYGRPPAKWLIAKELNGSTKLNYREIAEKTAIDPLAVRRLCEIYTVFLQIEHEIEDSVAVAKVPVKRLRLLHTFLRVDMELRSQIRRARDRRENEIGSTFLKLLRSAKSAGFSDEKELLDPYSYNLRSVMSERAKVLEWFGIKNRLQC